MAGRKKKNLITLLSLFAVMVFLIGTYGYLAYFKETQANQDSADVTAETTTLATLETDKIESVYFSNPDSTMTLLKDVEKGWMYKDEPSFPVNQTFAENMKAAFSNITSTMTVATDVNDLSEYGLKEPVIQVVATLEDQTSTSIALGYEAPITGGYYATVNGEKTVYIVSSTFYDNFNKSRKEIMAVENIPTMSADTITHLVVGNQEEGTLELNYEEDNYDYTGNTRWYIVQPYETPVAADEAAVTELLNSYTGMTFESAVDYDVTDLTQYGLDQPVALISLDYYEEVEQTADELESETEGTDATTGSEPTTEKVYKSFELMIGSTDEAGNYYVKSSDSSRVHMMSADTIEALIHVNPYSVAYENVSMINIDTVDKVVLETKDATTTMSINGKVEKVKNEETGEEEENIVKTYEINGKEADEDTFIKLYQTVISPSTESEIPKDYDTKTSQSPVLSITFHRNTDTYKTITIQYLPYDDSYYIMNINGVSNFLCDKRIVDEIKN
ncbi:MAG: hypothetical protein K0R92_1649 [Lachnospiraceae bacterium]|jgi:hypothetical protein|nr:hypothetical protein [Lachnospiraceae bacterium]